MSRRSAFQGCAERYPGRLDLAGCCLERGREVAPLESPSILDVEILDLRNTADNVSTTPASHRLLVDAMNRSSAYVGSRARTEAYRVGRPQLDEVARRARQRGRYETLDVLEVFHNPPKSEDDDVGSGPPNNEMKLTKRTEAGSIPMLAVSI